MILDSLLSFDNLMPIIAFMGLGPMEMVFFGVVAVLLFGSNLPSVAKSLGKSLTEFRRGMNDMQNEVRRTIELDEHVTRRGQSMPEDDQADPLDDSYEPTEEELREEGYPTTSSADNERSDS